MITKNFKNTKCPYANVNTTGVRRLQRDRPRVKTETVKPGKKSKEHEVEV